MAHRAPPEGGAPGPRDVYRLPSDHDWNCAVGIGEREKATMTPDVKGGSARIQGVYPWGTAWPLPAGAGNYGGSEAGEQRMLWTAQKAMPDYRDGFAYTAPVGSFPANNVGLFDLGGNAEEWCEDWLNPAQKERVSRGGAFLESGDALLSGIRHWNVPTFTSRSRGFRIVLAPVP